MPGTELQLPTWVAAQATLEGLGNGGTFQTSEGATVELIYCTAMWLQRQELTPEWQVILQTILQTVRWPAAEWTAHPLRRRFAWLRWRFNWEKWHPRAAPCCVHRC